MLINGPEERTIPGNALSVHPDLPFRGLEVRDIKKGHLFHCKLYHELILIFPYSVSAYPFLVVLKEVSCHQASCVQSLSLTPQVSSRERSSVSIEGTTLPKLLLGLLRYVHYTEVMFVNFFERDFVLTVIHWFESQRADLIILLFDAHKLDISDELKGAIDVLKGHEDKIRCILNKADQIDRQQLMRGKFCIEQFDS